MLFSYQPASAPIAQLDWAIGARAMHQLLLLFVNLCNDGSVVFWGFCDGGSPDVHFGLSGASVGCIIVWFSIPRAFGQIPKVSVSHSFQHVQ